MIFALNIILSVNNVNNPVRMASGGTGEQFFEEEPRQEQHQNEGLTIQINTGRRESHPQMDLQSPGMEFEERDRFED